MRMWGRMDLEGAERVGAFCEKCLGESLETCKCLIVDFQGINYISSSGLRVLVSLLKKIHKDGGQMALCGMNIAVEEVFSFAGLDTVFQIYMTEEEALEALDS